MSVNRLDTRSSTSRGTTAAKTHTVSRGDTLSAIATKNNVPLGELLRANPQITDPDLIFPGQELQIPDAEQRRAAGPTQKEYWTDRFEPSDNIAKDFREFTGSAAIQETGIPMTGNPFIDSISGDAVESQRATGVPASITMAQAILESGWGRSTLATEANNFFGMKGEGPAGHITLPTTEFVNGQRVTVQANFRRYHNPQESFEDHGRLLANNTRYAQAMTNADDPHKFAQELQRAGYATDPEYASKISKIINSYNLQQFDRLAQGRPLDPDAPVGANVVTVCPGDTLASIAAKHGTTWQEMAEINHLANPNLIYPGQRLKLPETAPTRSTPALDRPASYTVAKGDTMWGIARRFQIDLNDLIKANPQIKNPNLIRQGQKLNIPGGGTAADQPAPTAGAANTHTVKAGDTMWSIAREHGVSLTQLKNANPQITNPNLIKPGDVIRIPGGDGAAPTAPVATTPADGARTQQLLNAAEKYVGVPYQWGGGHWNNPYPSMANGLDCSGFVGQTFHDIGLELPGGGWRGDMRYHGLATHHFNGGKSVPADQLKPGDLVFWGKDGKATHEAIYMGNGKIIVAPKPGQDIKITNMYWTGFIGARRYL